MTIAFTYFGAGVQDRRIRVVAGQLRSFRTAFGRVLRPCRRESARPELGSATSPTRHFTDPTRSSSSSYFGVIATETGYFARRGIWLWADRMRDVRQPPPRQDAWSPLWYFVALTIMAIIGLMPSSTMIESPPGNMYFWFLIGMAMRFVDIAAKGSAARGYGTLQPASLTSPYALPAQR